jgi:hypothetical protein
MVGHQTNVAINPSPRIVDTLCLNKGDYVELFVRHKDGTSNPDVGFGVTYTYLIVAFLKP